jgi:hypothetical protein
MAHRLPTDLGDQCTLHGVPGPADPRPPGFRAAWNADPNMGGCGGTAVRSFLLRGHRRLLLVGRASGSPELCITEAGWLASQED